MEVLNSRVLLRPVDHEISVAFYRDTLGLAVYREFPGGTVLFLGGGWLEVVGSGGTGGNSDLRLWLQVRDVRATLTSLRALGVEVLREARQEACGLYEAWLADPDGNRIVLVEVPDDHPLRVDAR